LLQIKSRDKSILLVVSEFPPGPGGIGNHAYSLSKALSRKGYNVYVITNADFAEKDKVEKFDSGLNENIKIFRVHRNGIKTYIDRIKKVKKIVKTESVETVILSGKFSLWTGGLLKILGYSFKSIAILHGSEVRMRNVFFRKFTDYCISKADFLVPVSTFTYSLLNDNLKSKDYRIIGNGLDIYEMEELDKADRRVFGLKGIPALLTVGNVTPRKGQQRVIRALPEIVKHFPRVHYNIVGLPSYEKEFRELAKELGVEEYISFYGRLPERSDLAAAYKKADCFMILSENQPDGDVEGFGIVILEANYFGLPAIGAKGCGIEDAIENGYNGFLVDGDNSDDIIEKLKIVLEKRKALSENSVRWARKHSWNMIVEKYIEIL